MSEQEPRLSVRAQATATVPPDLVVLSGAVHTTADDKAAALAEAARALRALTDALSTLGAVPLDVDHVRAGLTWSARSVTTEDEMSDKAGGRWGKTGRVAAVVSVEITVRDFDVLPGVESVLAAQAEFSVYGTTWRVDDDNPRWPQVRANAIRSAVAKARDYAAALGGTVTGVEHIADTGLLGGGGGGGTATSEWVEHASFSSRASRSGGGEPTPSLDPVPCELTASIDARFTATGISLN
jgi:hypothetical protein